MKCGNFLMWGIVGIVVLVWCVVWGLFWWLVLIVVVIVVVVMFYFYIILFEVLVFFDGCVCGLVIMLDIDGKVFVWCGEIFGMVSFDKIVFVLKNVVVVIEDKCFYCYIGVDL